MVVGDRVESMTHMKGTVLAVEHDRRKNEGNRMAKVRWENEWASESWIAQSHLTVIAKLDIGPQEIPVSQRNYAAWGGNGRYRDGLD